MAAGSVGAYAAMTPFDVARSVAGTSPAPASKHTVKFDMSPWASFRSKTMSTSPPVDIASTQPTTGAVMRQSGSEIGTRVKHGTDPAR